MELTIDKDRVNVGLDGYKTPLRKLAGRFKASLEHWKNKYLNLKREIKRYQNQAADAKRSRDQWKTQAKQLKARTRELESELERLQVELQAGEKKRRQRCQLGSR